MRGVCCFSEFRFCDASQMVFHHDFRHKSPRCLNADCRQLFGNSGDFVSVWTSVVDLYNFRSDENFTYGPAGRQLFLPFILAARIDLKKNCTFSQREI